ncbi:MAG: RluA family pseudouridine synthase [Elusimicrobia bacterium]|nr:RluA family pseudouridine synthase [Elusimicrobiota bacterium]
MSDKEIICFKDGVRLDNYLKDFYPDYSREFIKKLILSGDVLVDGRAEKPSYKISSGEKILLKEAASKNNKDLKKNLSKSIVFEDKYFLAFNKPEGLLVHPTDSNWIKDREALKYSETLAGFLADYFGDNFCLGDEKMGLVHRLDRDTSGLILIAKDKESAFAMRSLFSERKIEKKYLGLAFGIFEKKEFETDAPIGRACGEKKLRVYDYGRPSLTSFKVLASKNGFSYLEISPKTGRTNQIRVHLAYLKAPIAGDNIYRGPVCQRLMLHSESLKFTHPFLKKEVFIKAEPSELFLNIIREKIGKIPKR